VQLFHRIKIFVYRQGDAKPDYLLLKPEQGIEGLWGPIQGDLGLGEQLEQAVRRRAAEATGVPCLGPVIDLDLPSRWSLGDEEVVEWAFGCRPAQDPDPARLSEGWAEHRWADFALAYPALGFENDREAMIRLHTLLGAA
jgi:predicted NUDIX family NTP pyrophosphohydrolase